MWSNTRQGKPEYSEGHQRTNTTNMTDLAINTEKQQFDSHVDSGFLSGSNLVSSSSIDEYGSVSGANLDSGVDISDQLGSLQIRNQGEDLAISPLGGVDSPLGCVDSPSENSLELPNSQDHTSVALLRDIFSPDSDGDTQLHVAVMRGFVEVIHQICRILPHQAFLDLANNRGKTALHLAVAVGAAPLVRHLLVCGASPVSRDLNGDTPLHSAIRLREAACVAALTRPVTRAEILRIRPPYTPSHTPGLLAADRKNYSGQTCIHVAASAADEDILQHLTQLGADVNAKEGLGGRTALHLAVEAGNERLAAHLVTVCRADVSCTTYSRLTPYQYALANGMTDMATFLLSLGAPALMLPDSFLSSDSDSDSDEEECQMVPRSSSPQLGWSEVNDVHLGGIPLVSTAPSPLYY